MRWFQEWHYLGNEPLGGRKELELAIQLLAQEQAHCTPRKPDSSLLSLLCFWVALIGKASRAPLSSFLLISLDHPGVCKHKFWQEKPAAIYFSLVVNPSADTSQWLRINPATSELMNTELKALPGQVHSFGRVTARRGVLLGEITSSVWFGSRGGSFE